MDILFVFVPVFIGVAVVFIGVIFVFILFQLGKQVAEWSDNNSKPILSEPARVVAKRSATSGNVSHDSGGSVSTSYYATFEYDTGERKEFWLDGGAYGLLVEGDEGTLMYQGTRYRGFTRSRRPA